MSNKSWAEVLLEQQRPMSPERLKAELQWQELTGRAAGLPPLPAKWWAPAAPAPTPRAPRGKGRRQPKAARVVLVEKKAGPRLLTLPDGSRVAGPRRTVRTTIVVNAA